MGCLNIDIGLVTVTISEEVKNRFLQLLGDSCGADDFYPGWIDTENPSRSVIGFSAVFKERELYADFHNLPFYYETLGWQEYHNRIVAYVAQHPQFEGWKGHGSPFQADRLPLLVKLLNQLVEEEWNSNKTPQQKSRDGGKTSTN